MLSRLQRRFDAAINSMPSTSNGVGSGDRPDRRNVVDRFNLFQSRTPNRGRQRQARGRQGRPGRRPTFTRQVTLLPSPSVGSIANYAKLQDDGLKTKKIIFPLDLSREQFLDKLREEFPQLVGITFRICKVGPNKELLKLEEVICTPRALRNHQQNKRSNIYILPSEELPRNEPDEEIYEVMDVVSVADEDREVEELVLGEVGDEEQPRATRNDQPGPGIGVEGRDSPTDAVGDLPLVFETLDETLDETRAIRTATDEASEESLRVDRLRIPRRNLQHINAGTPPIAFGYPAGETLAQTRRIREESDRVFEETSRTDRERVRLRNAQVMLEETRHRDQLLQEETRRQNIEDRVRWWAEREAVTSGIQVRFKYPDGMMSELIFRDTETIEHLYRAAGMVDGATSTFMLTSIYEGVSTSLHTRPRDTVLGTMNLHRSLVNVAWCDGDEEPASSQDLTAENSNSDDVNSADDSESDDVNSADDNESDVSLKKLIFDIGRQINSDLPANLINVYRGNVLDGGYRGFGKARFNPMAALNVKFSGECGIDNKGLTREFLTLALAAIKASPLLAGVKEKNLVLDYAHIEKYESAGALMAYSIAHRGPLPTFLSNMTYRAISGQEACPTLSDVSDSDVRDVIKKIEDSNEEELLNHLEFITQSGCANLTYKKDQLIKSLIQFHAIDRHREAFDRLRKGLKTLGVLDSVLSHPATWEKAFIHQDLKLTREMVENLFTVNFSPIGSNRRPAEEQCHAYWRDFLDELDEKDLLERLLLFSTGMKEIPTVGFVEKPEIMFRHRDRIANARLHTAEFPISNTCALQLSLPILSSYFLFSSRMKAAMDTETSFTME